MAVGLLSDPWVQGQTACTQAQIAVSSYRCGGAAAGDCRYLLSILRARVWLIHRSGTRTSRKPFGSSMVTLYSAQCGFAAGTGRIATRRVTAFTARMSQTCCLTLSAIVDFVVH